MTSATNWSSPPTRPPLIETLVSGVGMYSVFCKSSTRSGSLYYPTDRYNPSNVSILEDYLYHQIRSEEYDCLANLAILKLYVLYVYSPTNPPATYRPPVNPHFEQIPQETDQSRHPTGTNSTPTSTTRTS